MKILLIGGTGQLGSDLIKNSRGHQIFAPSRAKLDLERSELIDTVVRDVRPDWVVNAAAFHNVPFCEDEPERAFRINCVAVRDLALTCRAQDARLMTFSTDYVFGGEQQKPYYEGHCPGPLQIYGISKFAGERAALAVAPEQAVVIRTCGLYGEKGAGSKGGNFVDKRVKDGALGAPLEMSCDQIVAPTSTDDLSKAVLMLLERANLITGIYHLVNEGECSWYEFTREIFSICGFDTELRPVDREGRTGTIRRPLYSVLANGRARAVGVTMPHWKDALKRYLNAKYPS